MVFLKLWQMSKGLFRLRLTLHAADKWDSLRYLAVFNPMAEFCSQVRSASRPLAANAGR